MRGEYIMKINKEQIQEIKKFPNSIYLEFHRMLKQNTSDFHNGFSGVWKKIPNLITGSDIKLAQPWEVDIKIEDLLNWWEAEEKNFKNIVRFHGEFEKIHPFQDGNGRVGRFITLKQCIENTIDLIAIDERHNDEYKKALYEGQKTGDYTLLEQIFEKCQQFLNDKNEVLVNTLKCLGR
jgi:Fic family protein